MQTFFMAERFELERSFYWTFLFAPRAHAGSCRIKSGMTLKKQARSDENKKSVAA